MNVQANETVRVQAHAIATRSAPQVGIAFEAIMGIITIAMQLLPQLMTMCGGNATPKQRADNGFDESTGTFDRGTIHSLFPTLRQAQAQRNRESGENTRLDRRQLKVMAVETLTQARETDESTGVACMAAAAQTSAEPE